MAEINNENLSTEASVVDETVAEEKKVLFADRCRAKKESINNGFVRFLYVFITAIAIWFVDIVDSIKRNPIKIGAYLIAIPGIFIGFFMNVEIETIYKTQTQWAPLFVFALVLAGMINIFEAFSIISKKNFGSILIASILTGLIVVAGIVYIYEISDGVKSSPQLEFDSIVIRSFIVITVSMILSVVGCVIAWIFRDKNYKRDKF